MFLDATAGPPLPLPFRTSRNPLYRLQPVSIAALRVVQTHGVRAVTRVKWHGQSILSCEALCSVWA
eukprot:539373-Alexandrium_andersonii.AAC.1